jgi:hypothetical protein
MTRYSWRWIGVVVGALLLGALIGAYVVGSGVTECVDRVGGDSTCTSEVTFSARGAAVGGLVAGGVALVAAARRSRRR